MRPSTIVCAAFTPAIVTQALPITMLELDARARAFGREPHLDFRGRNRIEVGLPGEDHAVRRLPDEHVSPHRIGAPGEALENAAADAALDDDGLTAHAVRLLGH